MCGRWPKISVLRWSCPRMSARCRRCQSGPFDLGDRVTLDTLLAMKEAESEQGLDLRLLRH